MAVLTERNRATQAASDRLQILVRAEKKETRSRIATTLGKGDLGLSLTPIGAVEELLEREIDPAAILVLACDVDLPRDLALMRRLRRELRKVAIVAVSPVATGTGIRRALDAGADAIVFEPVLESTLVVAVSAVASGQSVVPRHLRASVERPAFSHRERQVLTYVVHGFTNAQIADHLFLSESTIKSHLSSVFTKLGVRSRKEAAGLFLEMDHGTVAGLPGFEPEPAAQSAGPVTP